MKLFSRFVIFNLVVGYAMAVYSPFSFVKPFREFHTTDWLLFIWIGLSIISGFLWWGYIFYHWGASEFKSRVIKRRWFWVILIGTMGYLIGPVLYSIVVLDMGRGLKGKPGNPEASRIVPPRR